MKSDRGKKSGSKSSWVLFKKQLYIHAPLFKRGILAVKHPNTPVENTQDISKDGFHINERKMKIYDPKASSEQPPKKQPPNSRRAKKILSPMLEFAHAESEREALVKKEALATNNPVIIYNEERRDETFLPVQVSDDASLYVYPWLSANQENFSFSGFEQFVTAGCLFGSSLKGLDKFDDQKVLIKHKIEFHDGQKIDHILLDSETPNSYEEMMFIELEKMAAFIDKFSDKTKEKRLLYHLPYYDYILFGIELFLCGRISRKALDDLFYTIFDKREEHSSKIKNICQAHNIHVSIESPFDNLFGAISLTQATKLHDRGKLATNILGMLDLKDIEVDPSFIDEKTRKENESALVRKCLEKLKTNTHKENHRAAWDTFIGELRPYTVEKTVDVGNGETIIKKKDKTVTLENLFKHANAVIVALASTGKQDYKTCSILPLTEKQIQVSYKKLCAKSGSSQNPITDDNNTPLYPSVLNATIMDPLVTYAPNVNGLAFYFSYCPQSLNSLIVEKDLLSRAHANTLFFRSNKQKEMCQPLEELLTAPSIGT